ncbi:hypothetical protein TOPH_03791 [Tolypocladium ophioglossoides CBS 100239]|uniref:Uncharacterized protein n=1 Tax=Tolypocladium ophioglossoides (strain CBS 100239) TaxID=1163406 RepID=A0A0L0NCD7_TOLOC|nr:hypothetical protein TOPH_03791 [Tolypocladium ophioglossoides CBS 100239]
MQTKAAFLLLLSACLIAPGTTKNCDTTQISHMNVGSCSCAGQLSGCSSNCGVCGITSIPKAVRNCAPGGCMDNQDDCMGCGIWFHSLCNCVQHPQTCTNSGTIKLNGPPVWVLLETDNLITTTELLPGILQMGTSHDEGWIFAQENYKPGYQAVWLNSVRSRDMEQVHIHTCDRNSHTTNVLSDEKVISSTSLVQLKGDPELYCLGVNNDVTIRGFSTALAAFLAKPPVCKELVGAGILHDHKGRTWACASTTQAGPKGKFC